MELGIGSYTYTWAVGVPGKLPPEPLDYSGLLHKSAELGVNRVQIADNLPLDGLSDFELEELLKESEKLGIQLEAGGRGMTEERLEAYLRIAGMIHTDILRFVIDGKDFVPDLDRINGIISNTIPVLKEKNIILALENYERLKVRDFVSIIEKAGSDQIGICLDPVNSFGAGEGLETVINMLGPLTVNLHVKEFTVKRIDHQMGFVIEGLPAGEGMLNLPWLLPRLGDRCRSAILEQWTPPGSSIEATVEKEDLWARKSMDYLKTII